MLNQYQQYLLTHPLLEQFIHVIIVLVAVLMSNVMVGMILSFFEKRLSKRHQILKIFYRSIVKPIRLMTWVIGLWVILTQIVDWSKTSFAVVLNFSFMMMKVLLIVAIVWALFRFSKELRAYFIQKYTRTDGGYNDFSLIETAYRCAQVFILILLFFAVLNALNISLVALAGVTSVVAGFIAISQQELIKNLFGGFVLHLDRPFSVGDWIYTTSGGIDGKVEKMSFRLTQIRGSDKRPIFVPNATFLTAAVVNASRMSNRRILQYIGIRYEDFQRLPLILNDVKEMLNTHKEIDQKMTILVSLINGKTNMGSTTEGAFGSSAINFMVYAFTKTTNLVKFQTIQDDVMIKVGKIIGDMGAEIAFPTTTIDLPSEAITLMAKGQEIERTVC
jgi:MscS family membrane protein